MPASMMSAPTGSTLKVIGSSMVIVAMGPMPGSTPMSVPTRQPMNARPTLCSVSAVENPRARFARRSVIGSASEDQDPGDDQDGDGQIEHVPEEADRQRGHHDREDEQLLRAGFRRRGAADHRHQGPGDGEPHGPDAEREGRDREEHEEGAAQRPAAERLAVLEKRTDHQPEAQDAEERGDAAGEQAWADRIEAAGPEIRGRPEGNRRDREQSQSRDEILRGADDAPALSGTCRNGFRFAGHSSSRPFRPGDTAPGRAPQIGLKSGWPSSAQRHWERIRSSAMLDLSHRSSRVLKTCGTMKSFGSTSKRNSGHWLCGKPMFCAVSRQLSLW